jgi:hypothetical protein
MSSWSHVTASRSRRRRPPVRRWDRCTGTSIGGSSPRPDNRSWCTPARWSWPAAPCWWSGRRGLARPRLRRRWPWRVSAISPTTSPQCSATGRSPVLRSRSVCGPRRSRCSVSRVDSFSHLHRSTSPARTAQHFVAASSLGASVSSSAGPGMIVFLSTDLPGGSSAELRRSTCTRPSDRVRLRPRREPGSRVRRPGGTRAKFGLLGVGAIHSGRSGRIRDERHALTTARPYTH